MKACLAAMLLVLLSTTARAADPFADVRATTLPNGLTVLLAPDSTARSVDVGVWVRAGSRWERPGETGITHVIERLMYMGTPRFGPGEYARQIQAEGGTFSASTSGDATCFESTVPPGGLATVLRLEADRFASLEVSQARLDVALRAVREERNNRAEQTAVGRGLRELYAVAFAGHPYRFPAVGLAQDVDHLTLRQVQAYRAARYVPGRMLVTICGRIDPAAALAAVRSTLGALRGGPLPAEKPDPAPAAGERRGRLEAEATAPVLAMGWRTPPMNDPDGPAIEAVAQVLLAGSASRLQSRLVGGTDAPCAQAQGALDVRAEGGLLYLFASPAPGVDTSRVESEAAACAAALASQPPADAEVAAAKRQLETDALFGWQTPAGVARVLGPAWLATGDPRAPAVRLDRIRALTAADLARAAARVLTPANQATIWIIPTRRPQEGRP